MNTPVHNLRLEAFTVAAYITAYEDAEALNACVAAIQTQTFAVTQILIVDNSEHPLVLTPPLQNNDTILVWSHPENLGIAGGLELAFNWADRQGYDFLWTFDQDSTPEPDCLARLLETYIHLVKQDCDPGIVAPAAIDSRTGQIVQPSRFLGDRFRGFQPSDPTIPYECDAPITSGSLVQMRAARQIPPPDRNLFMDGIDLDYGLRLRKAGFQNFVVPAARMYHRFGTPLQIELFGWKRVFQCYSPLRYYYICRNQTYLELRHATGGYRLTCFLHRINYLALTICKILVLDPESKAHKINACLTGTYHGLIGKLGKCW